MQKFDFVQFHDETDSVPLKYFNRCYEIVLKANCLVHHTIYCESFMCIHYTKAYSTNNCIQNKYLVKKTRIES